MTREEFSNEFDVLLNNYYISKSFGAGQTPIELDEYEKSLLLTEAQESIVKDLYNGRLTGEGFESTEELRRSLESLIKTEILFPLSNSTIPVLYEGSKLFELPDDVLYIVYEAASLVDESLGCKNHSAVRVYPVRLDELNIIKDNPFRGPSDKRVLRIDTGKSIVELISKYEIFGYNIKYISKLKPIILIDLTPVNLTIDGESLATDCELNSILHRPILERAVALAIKRLPSNNV